MINEMITLRPNIIRPNVRTHAKKDDFVSPSDAPGEGNRRFPTWDENDENEIKRLYTFLKPKPCIIATVLELLPPLLQYT